MRRSLPVRALALLLGMGIFLVLIPWGLLNLGRWVDGLLPIAWPRALEIGVGAAALAVGAVFLLWTTWAQWFLGGGTPNPAVPTVRLVVVGPYRLCRNPIQLGAICYWLGGLALLSGLTEGLLAFAVGLAVGSLYHRVFEEGQLERKFGEEYAAYRRTTPFLFPRLRRWRKESP